MASNQKAAIAVLDDYANIAPKHFEKIAGLQVDSFPETLSATKPTDLEALTERLKPYQIISSMRERTAFPATLINNLPNLKFLLTTGMRNAAIDLQAASTQNIVVTGTKGDQPATPSQDYDPPPPPGHSTVIQHAWALLLSLCSRIPSDDFALKSDPKSWQTSGTILALPGKTLGLFGLGKLGTAMGKTAILGFGMNVLAWSENLTQQRADEVAVREGLEKGTFRVVGKEEVVRRADVLSLHLVLSERTREVVGRRELEGMKRRAVLVNTSRGGLIDEEALIECLGRGGIEGFAADVFWEEPLGSDSVWRRCGEWAKSSVVLSPHMGYVNEGTMNRWYEEQAEIVQRYLNGEELLNKLN